MTGTNLNVVDLSCGRGGLTLLEGMTFNVLPGEAVVLRGPNGSGKTTLLRTLAGLQKPLAGRIDVDEESIVYSGHADGIKGTLSVAENLAFWAGLFGAGDIGAALEAFDLGALENRAAQTLSAGQKRRLGLARLCVTGRSIWALDEPTVSLDASSVALFANAVSRHLSRGGSAVIATHIDLGLSGRTIDVTQFKASAHGTSAFDEAFT